jgi:OMF family outer membrane factor
MIVQKLKKTTIKFLLGGIFLLLSQNGFAQEEKSFSNLEEVLSFAKEKNYKFENATIQTRLAELTKKTAWGNVFNPRIPTSIQALDNTQLQSIFMPGQVFGQPDGTYKRVTTGQQYTALFNVQPQFDIFNLGNITQVKSAKINNELTIVQNNINEQQVYDQINAIYFNILSYQGQIEILAQNIAIADTIFQATQNRFNEGVGRKQDVNEAEVNLINLQDKLQQLEFNIQIQQQSLALFFENSVQPTLAESVWNYKTINEVSPTNNTLKVQQAELQLNAMNQKIKSAWTQNVPILSFISSLNWQNLSNQGFFHANSSWITYNYVGLKLAWDFPFTVAKLSAAKNNQFQRDVLQNEYEHSIIEAQNTTNQMLLDYEKSVNQLKNLEKIAVLKEDTYRKNFNQYNEHILSLDKLLISHNDMLLAKINVVTALATVGFNKSKIDINNKF